MATATNDIDGIRSQMAQIRRELHEDVREVVASAEAVTDWHRYIRMYPWAALGVAAAVGYVIVPRRHKAVPADIATQSDVAKVRAAVKETADTVKNNPKKSLLAGALGLLAPVAARAIQGYAVRYLETWIAQLQEHPMMMAGSPPPSGGQHPHSGPGRPPGL